MQFLEEEINELTCTVWDSVLNLPIQPDPSSQKRDFESETVAACVHITGDWTGSVVLTVTRELAVEITSAMFDLESAACGDDLVNDAVGEVINMIGGNVKGLVPGQCQLSLPTVAIGTHQKLTVPGSDPVTWTAFRSGNEIVQVVLFVGNDAAKSHRDSAESAEHTEPAPAGRA